MNDRFFRFCRFFVRQRLKPYAIVDCGCALTIREMVTSPAAGVLCGVLPESAHPVPHEVSGPAVYVVHHQNLRGPITTMAWFTRPLRIWVLSVFCDRRTCFGQFYGYTFTQRFHYKRAAAAALAAPVSVLVPILMRSMNVIPVYRDPRETIKTFRQSLAALMAGESLLISPDVNYADSSETVGELYEGFLSLEKYYRRETGQHVPFIPLHIDVPGRRILVGKAICFRDGLPFRDAKTAAGRELRAEMTRMEQTCEP